MNSNLFDLMKRKGIILCFLLFAVIYIFAGEGSVNAQNPDSDWRIAKFAKRGDEHLFSFGLQGGVNLGTDIYTTNPFYAGFNLEVERILNKRWGIGFKLSPSFNFGGSEDEVSFFGLHKGYILEYPQTYEYSNFFSIPVYMTFKYYFSTGFIRPFLGLDAGISMLVGNIDGVKFLNTSERNWPLYASFCASPRVGILFDISENTRFAFDVYCNYTPSPEITGKTLTDLDVVIINDQSEFKPIWTTQTKTLSQYISVGLQLRLAIAF